LLGKKDLGYLPKKISKAVADNQAKLYKPRSGKVNGNLDIYTAEQLKYIVEKCGKCLQRFGYSEILDKNLKSDMSFFHEWNSKMIDGSVKMREISDYLIRSQVQINMNEQILRPKTEDDPARRGQRKFKHMFIEMRESLKP
jgi:hypothetical protein